MKILGKCIDRWKDGYVTLQPTNDEDMWHLYNLIRPGDWIRTKTNRKITHISDNTGLKKTFRKYLTLTLVIQSIQYYCQSNRLCIRLKGKNIKQHQDIKIGQYHTFQIEVFQRLKIIKQSWSPFEINLLKELSEITNDVETAAIVMDEGIAHLCLIKPSITLLHRKVQKNISKKSSGEQNYKKSLNKFLQQCYVLYKCINFNVIKCLIIASPGFINQQFYNYLVKTTQSQNDKTMIKNLQKIILVKSSTGYLNSLNQVLSDPKVSQLMINTKAINQNKILQKFYDIMKKKQTLVAYGQKDVFKCIQLQAVNTLLISDHLFHTKDFKKRIIYNNAAEDVKKYGGNLVVFSSLHPSGQKLKNISGIAAILRFQVQSNEQQQQLLEQNQQQYHLDKDLQQLNQHFDQIHLGQDMDQFPDEEKEQIQNKSPK